MRQVTVKVSELLDRVRKNKAEHRELFLKAQAGFRARAIEELDEMLALAKKTGEVRQYIGLVPPEDHTVEYDRIIDMLEMTTDENVTLDASAFSQLVRNEWAWFEDVLHTNSLYAMGGKRMSATEGNY